MTTLSLGRRWRRASAVAVLGTATLVAVAVPAAASIQNPGAFTFTESHALLTLGLVPVKLPAGSMAGQIDAKGNITIPNSSLQGTGLPFSNSQTIAGQSVIVTGTATFTTGPLTGTLDPSTGAMTLGTSLFASATFTGTLNGSPVYSGTCSIGGSAPASQLPVTLTTGPPGAPYSQQTGAVTLAADLGNPVACDPPLPSPLPFLLTMTSSGITVPGTTTPILLPGAGPPPNLAVSVSVVPPAVKSVILSVGSTSYTNCTYGSSTPTQLGFPNGACQAAASPVTVTNGTAPATITVTGADMVPADNGTHWALGGTPGTTTTGNCPFTPGADQYCETLAPGPGYNSGPAGILQPYLVLGNTATCDPFFGTSGCGPAPAGAASTEFLAMTGPSSSSDPSSTFTTAVTWTAS